MTTSTAVLPAEEVLIYWVLFAGWLISFFYYRRKTQKRPSIVLAIIGVVTLVMLAIAVTDTSRLLGAEPEAESPTHPDLNLRVDSTWGDIDPADLSIALGDIHIRSYLSLYGKGVIQKVVIPIEGGVADLDGLTIRSSAEPIVTQNGDKWIVTYNKK